jgi:hypothetical protein
LIEEDTEMNLKGFYFLLLFWTYPVYAMDITLTEYGVFHLSMPSLSSNIDPTLRASPNFALAVGGTIGLKLHKDMELEVGLIYLPRNFNLTATGNAPGIPASTYSTVTAQMPVLFRYWLSPNLSAGVGLYLGSGMGYVTVSQTDQQLSYDDLYWAHFEIGGVVSLRLNYPLNELASVVLDERFTFSLANLYLSGAGSYANHDLQSCLGISFEL